MKPFTDFPDISHSETEKRNLAKFREMHDKDYLPLTLKLWITYFAVGALTMAVICLIILNVNWKAVARWFNDLETWQYSVAILFLLCVISVSWTIVRSARRS